jgi:hypothetical protein
MQGPKKGIIVSLNPYSNDSRDLTCTHKSELEVSVSYIREHVEQHVNLQQNHFFKPSHKAPSLPEDPYP